MSVEHTLLDFLYDLFTGILVVLITGWLLPRK